MLRNQGGRSWVSKAVIYTLASAVAGLVAGAALGAVGSLLPLDMRLAVGSILAIAAIAVGGLTVRPSHATLAVRLRDAPALGR